MKPVSAIELYKATPRTNCKECGVSSCFIFAGKLVAGEADLDDCKPLINSPNYGDQYLKIREMIG